MSSTTDEQLKVPQAIVRPPPPLEADEESSKRQAVCSTADDQPMKSKRRRKNPVDSTLIPFLVPLEPFSLRPVDVVPPIVKESDVDDESLHKPVMSVCARSSGHTSIGKRNENQDVFFELTRDDNGDPLPCCAWGVLDGHGANGAKASSTATRVIRSSLLRRFSSPDAASLNYEEVKTLMETAFLFVFYMFQDSFFVPLFMWLFCLLL